MEALSRLFYKTTPADEKPSIKVLSHNVFWFQGAPFATDQPPAPRRDILEKLCAIYQGINPDVLCLQEIQSVETAQAVANQLGQKYFYRPGGNLPQYGGAVFSRWPMEECHLWHDEKPDRVSVGIKVHIADNAPLHIVSVHLPSSRQRGAEGGQLQRLVELRKVAGTADILLGDFNERPGGKCAEFLKEQKYVDAAEICNANEEPSTIGFKGGRGDQVWLRADKSHELYAYFVVPREQLATDIPEKKFLSDHLPVGCLLR